MKTNTPPPPLFQKVSLIKAALILGVALSIADTAYAQPTITSVSPESGEIGSTVTITGTGFNVDQSKVIVYFGAVKAKITVASAIQLKVTVPIGATYQPISVLNRVTGLTAYSAKPFGVTFTSNGVIDVNTFAPKVDFVTGLNPRSVAISDLDGDGKPDLAIVNSSNNTVSVFRNFGTVGTIAFAAKMDLMVGNSPEIIAIGDLDGDGKPDLAVTNITSNIISVLRNTSNAGTITFADKVNFMVGEEPKSIAISDLDGDGKPDLVVTNSNGSSISALRNTSNIGAIAFANKVDFAVGNNPYSVAIGDLDGDIKADLAIVNRSSNTVSVLRNTSAPGTITFGPKVDFITEVFPVDIAIGDLNSDGKPDLAVVNQNNLNVSVFRNTSNVGAITTSSFADKVNYFVGDHPFAVAINDLNGDGKPDLAITRYNTISVFKNTSTPGIFMASSFANGVDFAVGNNPFSVAIGDLDGNGKPDLAVVNRDETTVSILRNTIPNTGATLSLSNLSQPYTGEFLEVTVTTNPPNLSGVSVTYNGSTVPPVDAGSYTVTASLTNANYTAADVSGTFVITKESANATIPNILSPNGDGVNDVWVAYNPVEYAASEIEVKIFDQAGRLMFSQKPYLNNWNGTVEGRPLVANTYYYVVNFGTEQAKGFITLVRE